MKRKTSQFSSQSIVCPTAFVFTFVHSSWEAVCPYDIWIHKATYYWPSVPKSWTHQTGRNSAHSKDHQIKIQLDIYLTFTSNRCLIDVNVTPWGISGGPYHVNSQFYFHPMKFNQYLPVIFTSFIVFDSRFWKLVMFRICRHHDMVLWHHDNGAWHNDLFLATGSNISLKRKCCHFDEIFITGCTESCQNDNFQCSQWWRFRQRDDIFVSVISTAELMLLTTWLDCGKQVIQKISNTESQASYGLYHGLELSNHWIKSLLSGFTEMSKILSHDIIILRNK